MRWMHGTCIETPPQKIPGEDEPYLFTFFSDISTNPEVIDLVQMVQGNMKTTLTNLTRYLIRWKKYRNIWKVDKAAAVEKWFQKEPSVVSFDDRLQYYCKTMDELDNVALEKEQVCAFPLKTVHEVVLILLCTVMQACNTLIAKSVLILCCLLNVISDQLHYSL